VGFRESLAKAKESVADRVKTPAIPVVLDGEPFEVVFYRVDSLEWSNATAKFPPRPGVPLDAAHGYNIAAVAREISAVAGRVVEDGVEAEQTAEDWADFWSVVAPASARLIEVNVWHLHERDTLEEILRAKKALKPRRNSRKKSA